MNINVNDIFEFAKLRIECHVRALNYFADMFGLHFPDHDNDKNIEPMRTGYAYKIYADYHKDFHLLFEQERLCVDAKNTHHKHAPHHVAYYQNLHDMPDIRIYEMVCDWASANFERRNIGCLPNSLDLNDWFKENKLNLDWTPHQLEIIKGALKVINEKTDVDTVYEIWKPVLALTDL